MQDAGINIELSSGAKVFVRPEHYDAVVRKLIDWDLKRWHVVFDEEFEENVASALRSLPSREQTRTKGQIK